MVSRLVSSNLGLEQWKPEAYLLLVGSRPDPVSARRARPIWALTCWHHKRLSELLNAFKNILRSREIAHTLIHMDATKAQQLGRGRGRPPLEEGVDTIPVTVRMTAPQKEKLTRLGGSGWVRDRIDKAKEPAPKE